MSDESVTIIIDPDSDLGRALDASNESSIALGGASMADVVKRIVDLPLLTPPGRGPMPGRHLLEGRAFGLAHLALTLGESPPGQETRLHRHDAEEIIIVHAGRGMYTVGDTTVEVGPGEVVIIPSGVPHRWVNHTEEPLIHTGVFSTDSFAMDVLDD